MSQQRERAALDKTNPAVPLRPEREPCPVELRPPAQPPRKRCEPLIDGPPQPCLRAHVVDENDLAARLGHARELIERCLWVPDRRDDELGNHGIEGPTASDAQRAGWHGNVHAKA